MIRTDKGHLSVRRRVSQGPEVSTPQTPWRPRVSTGGERVPSCTRSSSSPCEASVTPFRRVCASVQASCDPGFCRSVRAWVASRQETAVVHQLFPDVTTNVALMIGRSSTQRMADGQPRTHARWEPHARCEPGGGEMDSFRMRHSKKENYGVRGADGLEGCTSKGQSA